MGLVETIIGTTEQVYGVGAVGYVRWGRCGGVEEELRGRATCGTPQQVSLWEYLLGITRRIDG